MSSGQIISIILVASLGDVALFALLCTTIGIKTLLVFPAILFAALAIFIGLTSRNQNESA